MSLSNPVWQFLVNADAVDVYVDTTSREQNSALFKWENDPQMLKLGFNMVIARFSANCESKLIWLDSGRKYLNGKWLVMKWWKKLMLWIFLPTLKRMFINIFLIISV